MPPPDRFVLPTRSFLARLRDNPLALAGVCAVSGLVAGGLIVAAVTHSPPKRVEASKPVINAAPVIKAAETTGAAALNVEPQQAASTEPKTSLEPSPKAAATDCQEQTWPYIARSCLVGDKPKRSVRVISTDRVADPVISAIEAPPPANEPEPPEPPERAVGGPPRPPLTDAAVLASTAAPPPVSTVAAAETASAAIGYWNPLTAQPAVVPLAPVQTVAEEPRPMAAPEPPRKRKARHSRSRPIESADADSDNNNSNNSSTRPETTAPGRGARIVERWTEREYQVPADGGGARGQRVIVIQRGEGRSAADAYYARSTARYY